MSEPTPTPTPTPSPTPTPPADPNSGNDPVVMAKRLGELESENKRINSEYKEYKERVDPVIETLWSDQELLKKATESHNKRLGVKTDPSPTPDPKAPAADPTQIRDPKARAAINNRNMTEFEEKHGITSLEDSKKQEVRGMVGQMIKNMVDPQNNRTIQQVFDEIDPDRFPWYLENAYSLINKQSEIEKAKEEGKNEVLNGYQSKAGIIGPVAGGVVDLESVTLTPKERVVAKNMGISEEQYLKNKKRIIEIRNRPEED